MTNEVKLVLDRYRTLVDAALEAVLPEVAGPTARLHEAMRYSVLGGGKRIRPALCLASCEAVGAPASAAAPAGAALELVHAYSLVHDDLPCMDDDDLRRGRPTNHRVFGEALAVLAGDGLLTLAFEVLAEAAEPPQESRRLEMIRLLAHGAGLRGMVGGQALDVESEGLEEIDLPTLQFIHTRKTGALVGAACRMGAICGGGNEAQVASLGKFGEKVGLAFQIVDDLLDETGASDALGKSTHKDRSRGKMTYPRLFGMDESRRKAKELGDAAVEIAAEFGSDGRALHDLARHLMERTS